MNSHVFRKSIRHGFNLIELVVVIGIIVMLIALFLPVRRTAGEAARRNTCSNAIRQIVLASLNHEDALQRFPLAMSGPAAPSITVHGPAPFAVDDGYSYAIPILSYMEETALAGEILDVLHKGAVVEPVPLNSKAFNYAGTRDYVWDRPVELLICPSFPGENLAQGDYLPVRRPQASNYHAMVAGCVDGTDQRFADVDPKTGGVFVTQQASEKGIKLEEITDGASKTIVLTESRGEEWVAWFSGVSTSTVAISPDVANCKKLLSTPDAAGYPSFSNIPSGLNYGSKLGVENSASTYFWTSREDQRAWGPSSAHNGGVIMTGYADGHVKGLNEGIDATTYFRLSTRGGDEPADDG